MLIVFKNNSEILTGTINFIFDGDSFRLNDGKQIRLGGVDSPEHGQPFAEQSKSFLIQLIPPKSTINYEIIKIDKYERIIAIVHNKNGILVAEELVKRGLSFVYYHYLSDLSESIKTRLVNAEKYAKENKLNIWSQDNIVLPEDYRKLNNIKEI